MDCDSAEAALDVRLFGGRPIAGPCRTPELLLSDEKRFERRTWRPS